MILQRRNVVPAFLGFRTAIIVAFLSLAFSNPILGAGAEEYLKKGKDYISLTQWEKAREQLEKSLAMDPTLAEAHFQLGYCLGKLNQLEKAASSLETALKFDSELSECRTLLAKLYLKFAADQKTAGNRPAMISFLQKGCNALPSHPHNWLVLFENFTNEKRWRDITASADLVKKSNREALELGENVELQSALILISKAFKEQKDFNRAKEYASLAGMIHQQNAELDRLKTELAEKSTQSSGDLLEQGRKLFDAGNYEEALDKLKSAQSADSGNQEIVDLIAQTEKKLSISGYVKTAREAEKKGDFQKALDQLQLAIGIDEEDMALRDWFASVTEKLEVATEKENKIKAAEYAKRQELVKKREKLEAILKAARDNEKKRAFNAALISYQEALTHDPENAELKETVQRIKQTAEEEEQRLGRFNEEKEKAFKAFTDGDFDQAYETLKTLCNDPLNSKEQTLPKMIETCLKLGKTDEADSFLGQVPKEKAEDDLTIYLKGMAAFQKGDYGIAREHLTRVNQKNPNIRPELPGMLRTMQFHKYKYGIYVVGFFLAIWSISLIRSVVTKLKKKAVTAKIDRALASGNYDQVIPLLEERLADIHFDGNRRQLTHALAEAYLRKGRFQDAIQMALEIVAKEPRNASAQRILGEASFQMKENSPEAIERIHNVFKMDESRKDLLTYLATHFRTQLADHKLAMEIFQKQTLLSPDDKDTLFYLADHAHKKSNFQTSSLKTFEKAMKLNPDKPEYIHGLIQCLNVSGKKEEAARFLEKGREKFPGNEFFTQEATYTPPSFSEAKPEPRRTLKTHLPGSASFEPPPPAPVTLPQSAPIPGFELPSLGDADPGAAPPQNASPGPALGEKPSPTISNGVNCKFCGGVNNPREYYCTTCGKPLKSG